MSMWRMPNSDKASTTAFITAGNDPAQPASPHPLAPSGLVLAGTGCVSIANRTGIRRPRHGVVGKRPSQELAIFVKDGALHQRLPDALDNAAMRLTGNQQRVHNHPEIIDHGVLDDLDNAGLGINLDLGDVNAIGKGRGRAFMNVSDIERLRQFRRQGQPAPNHRRQFHEVDKPVGAGDDKAAIRELDVGDRGFEYMGGDLAAVVDDLFAGADNRRSTRHQRFRSAGAAAGNQLVAVALQQPDALKWNAELFV
jgi:hypothetical protein